VKFLGILKNYIIIVEAWLRHVCMTIRFSFQNFTTVSNNLNYRTCVKIK
jgi:hypothetical protein